MTTIENRRNRLILSYNGTCCIYQSDLRILQSDTEWLNDSCINFQMIRLSERNARTPPSTAAAAASSPAPNGKVNGNYSRKNDDDDDDDKRRRPRVVFIDPCIVSFFVHQICIDDDEDEDRDEILNLYRNTWKLGTDTERQRPNTTAAAAVSSLMIPINDNHAGSSYMFQTPGAGNHWSLLLVLIYEEDLIPRPTKRHQRSNHARYFHFDSSRGTNRNAARIVATRVESILSIGSTASMMDVDDDQDDDVGIAADMVEDSECAAAASSRRRMSSRSPRKRSATSVGVVECMTPQQSNGYDCGLCTLANAEALSAAIDGLPRRRCREDGCDGEESRSDEDGDKVLKKWFEQTLKTFAVGYGGIGKMSKAIRRSIAADVLQLKTSNMQ